VIAYCGLELSMRMPADKDNLPQFFTSLRSHLITLILLAVIPTFGVILYSANQHRDLTADQAQRNALGAARAIAAEQERFLENAHQFLVMLSRIPQIRDSNRAACSKFLAGLLEPLYVDLGLTDREGNLLCSALPPGKSLVAAKGAHHKRAIETHEYSVGTIRIDKATGKTFADLAFPLLDSSAVLRRVVVAALDLSWVTRITAQNHLYPGATFTLVDGRGTVLLRYPQIEDWHGKPILAAIPDQGMGSQDTEKTVQSVGADGIARLFAFSRLKSPVGGQAAYAVVDMPAAMAFAEANRILLYDLVMLALLAASILTVAWFGADVFVLRRIHDIVNATKQVAAGTLTARTKIPYGTNELSQMARTFDDLAAALEKREAEVHASATKIHEQRQQQSALYDLNLAITSTLDLASVLRTVLEEITALFPSCGASVEWINRNTGALEPIAQRNLGPTAGGQRPAAMEIGLPLVVLTRQAPLAISNTHTDPRTGNPEFFRIHHFRSYLGLPMIAKGETVGVLSIYVKDERGFGAEELAFLTALVNQAAIAIHNSRLFEQTRNQAAELERSNKIKDEFLGVMSHELRTPLNIIMNYAEALQMGTFGQISADQEKGTYKIRSQAGHLLSLINGILEITKIESGTVTLLKEPIDLVEFMADNRTDYVMPMEKELTLEWHYSADLPVIESDRMKLRQVLTNLINNAIKFTDQGSVIISANLLDEGRTVEFQVTDTGPGIPHDLLPFVFDKFCQIDSTTTRHYSGAGLGLYIVKCFVEILGGTVSVQSKLGEGSLFSVRLPVNTTSSAPCDPEHPANAVEAFLN
jgi:signal transduction histidine kinase/HAMP domain-containing protein